jgi:GntR family transcriptional regulator
MGRIGYRELANRLRDAVLQGEYPEASTLPRQEDIADQYGVNVNTVREAVRLLEAEGLVTSVRRRGTVVRSRPPMKRLGAERYAKSKWKYGVVAFMADREASGREWKPEDQVATVRTVPADQDVADALDVPVGTKVYERARVVSENGQPTHTLTSYYRPADVKGTPLAESSLGPAGRGGGFMVLTLQGLEPSSITETISSRMPTPDEIEQLQLLPGEPVVLLTRITSTKDGHVVEYARGVHAASRFAWTYTFEVPD